MDTLASYEIPPVITKYLPMDDIEADDSEVEIDEKLNVVIEDTIYADLPDLDETIVQSVIQTSLIEMPMAGRSEASVADMTWGTDALTDGATL